MEALLGPTLVGKSGEVSTSAALADCEVIGLYFSAHWCGPCRGFTPHLADVYKKLRGDGKKFEVVFVSSDKDDAAFKEYHGEMPWLALPFADRERKSKLSGKYKVNGIPTLVLLKGNGELITTGGRAAVQNPADWPFIPPTAAEVLSAAGLVNGAGEKVSLESITGAGKYLGLYFSAHWCPPCQRFTPKLAETYKKLQAAGAKLEIVFVSSDRDKEAFDHYFATQPWLALPFDARDAKGKLSAMFDVAGIPTLILLGPDLKVVNADARAAVDAGRDFPWLPPDVMDLEEDGGAINESPALIVLMEKAETAWDEVEKTLTAISKEQKAAGDEDPVLCFTAKEIGGGITDQVRKLFKLGNATKVPQAVLADFPSGGKFSVIEGGVTADSLRKAVSDFKAGTLAFKSLGDGGDGDD